MGNTRQKYVPDCLFPSLVNIAVTADWCAGIPWFISMDDLKLLTLFLIILGNLVNSMVEIFFNDLFFQHDNASILAAGLRNIRTPTLFHSISIFEQYLT